MHGTLTRLGSGLGQLFGHCGKRTAANASHCAARVRFELGFARRIIWLTIGSLSLQMRRSVPRLSNAGIRNKVGLESPPLGRRCRFDLGGEG